MSKEIRTTTYKLITELLAKWEATGDEKYMEAIRQILETIKGLK